MAVTLIRAKYHDGILSLLDPIDLPEGAEVTLSVEYRGALSDEEKRKRFFATAGAWKDALDWDEFLRETYESRKRNTRPEATW